MILQAYRGDKRGKIVVRLDAGQARGRDQFEAFGLNRSSPRSGVSLYDA
jgi:hypothetical protein